MKASDPYRTAYVRILKEELRADQTVCVLAGKGLPAQRGKGRQKAEAYDPPKNTSKKQERVP